MHKISHFHSFTCIRRIIAKQRINRPLVLAQAVSTLRTRAKTRRVVKLTRFIAFISLPYGYALEAMRLVLFMSERIFVDSFVTFMLLVFLFRS